MEAVYDYLWIQFYNNVQNPPTHSNHATHKAQIFAAQEAKPSNSTNDEQDCAAADLFKPRAKNPNGKATYNLASWPSYLSAGASANATLFLGLPASPDAAVPYDFVQEGDLLELLKQSPQAGGVMLWDTAHSDQSVQGGCTVSGFPSSSPCLGRSGEVV